MELCLKGGLVLDPSTNLEKELDLRIKGNKIVEMGEHLEAHEKVVNLEGKIVAPGFIDLHVHLREPGGKYMKPFVLVRKQLSREGLLQ